VPTQLPAHLPHQPLDALGGPDQEWLFGEITRLLDGASSSRVAAGGFGWLDGDGRLDPARGRPLWITTRMTHCFALGRLLGREQDGPLADHGVAALGGLYRDTEFGGWHTDPDHPGDRDDTGLKGAYGHAFVILAASSATAADRPGGRELLADALAVSERYFWDDRAGAVAEEWDRGFAVLDPYRGANANMHTVEAYLAAADATGDRTWRDRALRIASRIIGSGAHGHEWRVPEHFDADWTEQPDYNRDAPAHPFRPYGATPGHGLEWGRLLLHLEASLAADGLLDAPEAGAGAHSWLRRAAIGLFDRALTDGWDDEHGGICYTTDWDGTPVVAQHFHWVTCEAIATAALLHRVTGEERFAEWYRRMWDYAREHFLDGRPGWQMEVDPDGAPSSVTWNGRPDTYHALQVCLVPMLPLTPAFASALAG
jgi:mannose/cellobiose epimerase-like protein (N-acyl-D-glucosamine 2-epimerase family)